LSPVTGIHVERRYLIPLKEPNGLCSKNWAKFAFDKLVEGVSLFQGTGIGLAECCILFLQLFYLDVVSNGMFVLSKTVKPVMIWGAD
ncbi:hypothetical protein Q0P11_14470, partial [Staphylococcus aureus]|nr:hypothetical protein [Staphylococcus aureus]